jgi:RNAse (barnase) inhibitor barstar
VAAAQAQAVNQKIRRRFEVAVFREDEWGLDRQILQRGAICLYFRPEVLEEDVKWFRENQYLIHQFDCATWNSEDDFHTDVDQKLGFPDYYGGNLNAFNDCLSDIEVPDSSGTVLVFLRFDAFAKEFPQVAWNVLDIIETNSRRLLLTGQRLIALVQSDDPAISFEPVGACAVSWNSREWLNNNRGL